MEVYPLHIYFNKYVYNDVIFSLLSDVFCERELQPVVNDTWQVHM